MKVIIGIGDGVFVNPKSGDLNVMNGRFFWVAEIGSMRNRPPGIHFMPEGATVRV